MKPVPKTMMVGTPVVLAAGIVGGEIIASGSDVPASGPSTQPTTTPALEPASPAFPHTGGTAGAGWCG